MARKYKEKFPLLTAGRTAGRTAGPAILLVVFLLQDGRKGRTLLQIPSMRNVFLTLSPVLLSASLSAQGVFSNRTQLVLEKVIQDYPNHFINIKGELISQASQSSRYKSILQLPGAQSVVITVSTGSQPSGWSCTVLETRSFGEARQRFAAIYGELSNSIIAGAGHKTYILSGQYEIPVAEK